MGRERLILVTPKYREEMNMPRYLPAFAALLFAVAPTVARANTP